MKFREYNLTEVDAEYSYRNFLLLALQALAMRVTLFLHSSMAFSSSAVTSKPGCGSVLDEVVVTNGSAETIASGVGVLSAVMDNS
jgi:hypothetical protein